MQDNTIYIGFSTPKAFNPVSWIVRKLTKSNASHTWVMYFDEDLDMYVVMEAHELGFRILPFKRFSDKNKIVAIIDPVWPICNYSDRSSDGLVFLSKFLGSGYDWLGLIGNAIVILGEWLHLRWHNPFKSKNSMFCSEANVRMLQIVKYPGAEVLIPDDISPQDLLDLLSGHDTKLITNTNIFYDND